MAIKIKVPNANFNGKRGGVQFYQGVGIFEDEELGKRIAFDKGYEIVEINEKESEAKDETKAEPKKTTSRKKTTKSEK